VAGYALALVSPEMVYLYLVSPWQFESWLPDSGVNHMGRVDHRGGLTINLRLTGDACGMNVCSERFA